MQIDEIIARYDVRPARYEDALHMKMRAGDVAEILAYGADPRATLVASVEYSLFAWTWSVDDRPLCILGVGSDSPLGGIGRPWLLSGEGLERHAVPFLRHHRPFIGQMLSAFPRLENYVDARYCVSVKWLKWMGFQLDEAKPYGLMGASFHRFHMGF